MPHVTGNYSETEQIAHLFLAVRLPCIGLATLCESSHKTLYTSSYYIGLSLFLHILKRSTWLKCQNNLFSANIYLYRTQSVSQTPKQNTHIHNTTQHVAKQNDWATVEQHTVKLLWSTLGLFVCLGPIAHTVLLITNSFAMITCPRG